MNPRVADGPVTADAVVFVPGIMGSALRDVATGKLVWGLGARALASAIAGDGMSRLAVTEDELDGRARLEPAGVLSVPSYLPMLGGVEPYRAMLEGIPHVLVDPRALSPFSYDWRLSIDHAALRLVSHCESHLENWRRVASAEFNIDPSTVQLQIVAHSMGGLVARYATDVLGLAAETRAVLTLGTPYMGAVKAMRLLAHGAGAPIPVPKRKVRDFAVTAPGVYDLLPRYRCVGSTEPRKLTPSDVGDSGGNIELATRSEDRWHQLGLGAGPDHRTGTDVRATGLFCLSGTFQPTLQSVIVDAGVAVFSERLDGVDYRGDSTVFRSSAQPAGVFAATLPQSHGAIAKASEGIGWVQDTLVSAERESFLGTRPLSLRLDGDAVAGVPPSARVSAEDGDPTGITVYSTDLETGEQAQWRETRLVEAEVEVAGPVLRPGLHRVEVRGGGHSPVAEMLLVTEP